MSRQSERHHVLAVAAEDASYVLGRSAAADVRIDDPRVSRRHVLVDRDASGGWVVRDAGSRNGTFYRDGRPLHQEPLTGSLHVRLGHPVEGVLVEVRAPEPPQELPSSTHAAVVTIGRGGDSDVVLDHPTVSLLHAEVRTHEGMRVVVDGGSRNGTYVNGERVASRALRTGDRITCGARDVVVAEDGVRTVEPSTTGGLRAEHVTVTARRRRVLLDDVSFVVGPNTLLAVIGPSGAGKSTLIKAITGFKPPAHGRVVLDGRDVAAEFSELKDRIGLVPQDDVLHAALTVRQCLRYAASLRLPNDMDAGEREARVDDVLRLLELTHRADVRIRDLSGGQRKRVNTALELLTEPALLVLDEPTSGLDPHTERRVMAALRQLVRNGRIVVVVTHSMKAVEDCDEVMVIAGGRLTYHGPPQNAPSHFAAHGMTTVFGRLDADHGGEWAARWSRAVEEQDAESAAGPPVDLRTPHGHAGQGGARRPGQTGVLVKRYVRMLASDRLNLAILLAQAPVLGGLARLFDDGGGMVPGEPPNREIRTVLLVLVLSITWLGTFNGTREIVKERAIFRRERAAGVSPVSYLTSKILVLGALTALQTAVLLVVTLAGRDWPGGVWLQAPGLELGLGLFATGVTALLVALLVSGLVSTSDKAVAFAPLLVVPQLVLCGALMNVADRPALDVPSRLVTARAGFSAVAASVDLPRLERGAAATAVPDAEEPPAEWRHDVGTWLGNIAILAALASAAYGALLRALVPVRRRPRSRNTSGDACVPAPRQGEHRS